MPLRTVLGANVLYSYPCAGAYLSHDRKLTLVIVLAASSEHPPWEFAATLQQVSLAALQLVWATLQLLSLIHISEPTRPY